MDAAVSARLDVEPMLTGADIVVRWGRSPASLARAGAVLVWTTVDGQRLYPEVQFDVDGPVPVIADVLAYLGGDDPEAVATAGNAATEWFYTPRPSLRGQAPIDVLHENPDAVRALALTEADADNDRVMSG